MEQTARPQMTPAKAAFKAPKTLQRAEKQLLRSMFRHRRHVIPTDLVHTTNFKAANLVRSLIADLTPTVVSLYMPRQNEVDLTLLVQDLWEANQTVCLPRVVQRGHPLVFNIWNQGRPLEPDALGIPAATGPEIIPSVIVIPMVGYNREGYRLGSGGGYFDRTLAALKQPVITIGVCFTELEIPDFPAEEHDTRLNYIVTGKEIIACNPR